MERKEGVGLRRFEEVSSVPDEVSIKVMDEQDVTSERSISAGGEGWDTSRYCRSS